MEKMDRYGVNHPIYATDYDPDMMNGVEARLVRTGQLDALNPHTSDSDWQAYWQRVAVEYVKATRQTEFYRRMYEEPIDHAVNNARHHRLSCAHCMTVDAQERMS